MKKITIVFLIFVFSQFINADLSIIKKDEVNVIEQLVARSIAGQIKSAFEKFREMMKTGNKSLGIPVLDPFKLDYYHVDVAVNDSHIIGNLSNLSVEKTSGYVIQKSDFKITGFKLTIDLLWPLIVGKTNYEVKGTALNKFPIYGSGDISFKVQGFRFATEAKLKLESKTRKFSIKEFNNTSISINEFRVDITGLFDHEDLSKLVSEAVSDLLPETLEDYQEEVTAVVDKILLEKGNQFLANYTIFP